MPSRMASGQRVVHIVIQHPPVQELNDRLKNSAIGKAAGLGTAGFVNPRPPPHTPNRCPGRH